MSFKLEKLPFEKYALKPHISEETVEYHYEKHHRGYVDKLNKLTERTDLSRKSLDDIVKTEKGKVFNMAGQVWNHDFYWKCLSPNGGGMPSGKINEAIISSFGSFESFKEKFNEEAINHFGSGWIWLVRDDNNKLSLFIGHDAGNPLTEGLTPVLTCDVWEHAYYIDCRNNRGAYIEAWWKLVNWTFAERNLK